MAEAKEPDNNQIIYKFRQGDGLVWDETHPSVHNAMTPEGDVVGVFSVDQEELSRQRLFFSRLEIDDIVQLIDASKKSRMLKVLERKENTVIFEDLDSKQRLISMGSTLSDDYDQGRLYVDSFSLGRIHWFRNPDTTNTTRLSDDLLTEVRLYKESLDGGYESVNIQELLDYHPETTEVFNALSSSIHEATKASKKIEYRGVFPEFINVDSALTYVHSEMPVASSDSESQVLKISFDVVDFKGVLPKIKIILSLNLPDFWVAHYDGVTGEIDQYKSHLNNLTDRMGAPGITVDETKIACDARLRFLEGIITNEVFDLFFKRIITAQTKDELDEIHHELGELSKASIEWSEQKNSFVVTDDKGVIHKEIKVEGLEKDDDTIFILCNGEGVSFDTSIADEETVAAVSSRSPIQFLDKHIGEVVNFVAAKRKWHLLILNKDFIQTYADIIKTLPQRIENQNKRPRE